MSKNQLIFAKLDPGFYSNRKVRRAGRDGRDLFLFALCLNAARGAKGSIPLNDLDPEYVADILLITEEQARNGVTRACHAGLLAIDGDRVLIGGWDQDWARRPLTNAERQEKYRDRHRDSNDTNVTSDEKVTRNGSEERRGEERERARYAPESLSLGLGSQQRPEAPRSSSIGLDNWHPSAALTARASELGLDPAHELAQFRLNARARGHVFADPEAAFEKFMRGSRDIGKKPKRKAGATTTQPKPIRVKCEDGTVVEDRDGVMHVIALTAVGTK